MLPVVNWFYSIVWKHNPGFVDICFGFVIFLDWILGDCRRILGVSFAGLLEGFSYVFHAVVDVLLGGS